MLRWRSSLAGRTHAYHQGGSQKEACRRQNHVVGVRWGWGLAAQFTQGSSRLATLGFEPESRWDSLNEFMLRAVEWACEAGRFAIPTKSDHMILHSAGFLLTCPLVVPVCSSCKT